MNLQYVPLLQIQRDLQAMPRNYERFRAYLRAIFRNGKKMALPLGIMNPMGKDHVTALLDALLAIDAEAIGALAVEDASAHVARSPGDFKIGLVVADDLLGGWTNRYDYEFKLRVSSVWAPSRAERPKWLEDYWVPAVLWSSEPAGERAVREAVQCVVHRAAYIHRNGVARTLRDILAQEGHVMSAAGCSAPTLDDDDIAYTREVLTPFLGADDMRTCIECLFGDAAGKTLGFTPHGLSPWAGLALALHDHVPAAVKPPSTQIV